MLFRSDYDAEMFGAVSPGWWGVDNIASDAEEGLKNLAMRHNGNSTLTISYQSETSEKTYHPYIAFDKQKKLKNSMGGIAVYALSDFKDPVVFRSQILMANSLCHIRSVKSNLYDNNGWDKGVFIGSWNSWGLLVNERGIFWLSGSDAWGGTGVDRSARQKAALRISNAGDTTYQGGMWGISNLEIGRASCRERV